MRILVMLLVVLAAAVRIATAENSTTAPNAEASGQALHIDLGPLPAEAARSYRRQSIDSRPRRIGIHRPVPEDFADNLVPDLQWVDSPASDRIAIVTVVTQAAVSIRIAVQAVLPPNASVQVLDVDGVPSGRSYTPADFRTGNSVWLPSVQGDTLTVEITTPHDTVTDGMWFSITNVAHRFASNRPMTTFAGCPFVNAECAPGDRRQLADSIGQVNYETEDTMEGYTMACSGTLLDVPDTPDIRERYFLTAGHCISNQARADTAEVYWFFRAPTCEAMFPDQMPKTSGGAELLAVSKAQDASLIELRESPPAGVTYAAWTTDPVRVGDLVFSFHHPGSGQARYSEGSVQAIRSDTVGVLAHHAIIVDWSYGLAAPGSSGGGLFDGKTGALVGTVSGGPLDEQCPTEGIVFGSFQRFHPRVAQWLSPNTPPIATFDDMLPAVPGADTAGVQGFIRLMNFSSNESTVEIHAIDDEGRVRGPLTITIPPLHSAHFNSHDLEHGNPDKRLDGSTGNGTGMWRLGLNLSDQSVLPLAYIRTNDGFVTSMHQTAESRELPNGATRHFVPIFNPASNTTARSILRVINLSNEPADVQIFGFDNVAARSQDDIRLVLGAHRAIQITAAELERGSSSFSGSFGDGTGKWEIYVDSTQPLTVMSLMQTGSGHLTNLSQ